MILSITKYQLTLTKKLVYVFQVSYCLGFVAKHYALLSQLVYPRCMELLTSDLTELPSASILIITSRNSARLIWQK